MELVKNLTKGERTRQFIIESATPVFNRKGYVGTSMSDITKATGLTKGAIYGNFENKEELALEAFNFSFRRVVKGLNEYVGRENDALSKLRAIVMYYRSYYDQIIEFGGCPILNIGVDTHHNNPLLFERVKVVMGKMIDNLIMVIEEGKNNGQFKADLDSTKYAHLIFAQIEGGIFMAVVKQDRKCLSNILDHLEQVIDNDMCI